MPLSKPAKLIKNDGEVVAQAGEVVVLPPDVSPEALRRQMRVALEMVNRLIIEKLSKPVDHVGDHFLLRAWELAQRGAGFGVGQQHQPPVTVNVVQDLEALGGNLKMLLRKSREEIRADEEARYQRIVKTMPKGRPELEHEE